MTLEVVMLMLQNLGYYRIMTRLLKCSLSVTLILLEYVLSTNTHTHYTHHIYILHTCTYIYTLYLPYIYIHVLTYTHIYTLILTHIHIVMFIYVYILHSHTHTQSYKHTYTHKHIISSSILLQVSLTSIQVHEKSNIPYTSVHLVSIPPQIPINKKDMIGSDGLKKGRRPPVNSIVCLSIHLLFYLFIY